MSDLRTRESGRPAVAGQKPVPVLVAALTTGCWAAVVSSAPVVALALVAWIADTRSGAPAYDAVRVAFNGWLLAHGVRLQTGAGPVGLAPLALSILAFRQLSRAGGNSARATGAATIGTGTGVVVAVAAVYGLLGAVVAFLAGTPGVHAHLARAGGVIAAFAVVAVASGVLRANGIGATVLARLPVQVGRALVVGAIAAGIVLGAGALLAGVALAFAADDVTTMFGAFRPGAVGSASLFGLSVIYTPTAAVWGAAYLVGPGFAVGSGTSVSAIDVSLGPMPAFPLLAGLPVDRASTGVSLLLGVPLVAGVVAGIAAARRRRDDEEWAGTLAGAALGGPVAGALLGIAAYAAGGPLGADRLAAVGPSPWRVALVGAIEVTLFAVVGVALARILSRISGRAALPATRADSSAPARVRVPGQAPPDRSAAQDEPLPQPGPAGNGEHDPTGHGPVGSGRAAHPEE